MEGKIRNLPAFSFLWVSKDQDDAVRERLELRIIPRKDSQATALVLYKVNGRDHSQVTGT